MDKTPRPCLFFFQRKQKISAKSQNQILKSKIRKNKNNKICKTDAISKSTKNPDSTQQNTHAQNRISSIHPKETQICNNSIHPIQHIHK